jgi:hypothetical protein
MPRNQPNIREAIGAFLLSLVVSNPEVTFDQLQEYFRSAASALCDQGLLKQHEDERMLNGFPLEWAVKRIFLQIQAKDSRKAWSRFLEPEHPNIHEFIFERGFRDEETDAERFNDAFHFRFVFEVKSHWNHGATIDDLRQLEDWVGRLNRDYQKTLPDEALKHQIAHYRPLLSGAPETERLYQILNPYKGVFILNHEWTRDKPSQGFGRKERAFAQERNFCLIEYRDLLLFREAILQNHMDAWWFVEEIALQAGVLSYVDYSGSSTEAARNAHDGI